MIAHICRLSLRHKSSIQANSYRLPYARSSYGSLTYLHQKLRRCLQFPLPRKKRLLRLCPDIIGEFDVGHAELIYTSGAFSLIAKEASNYGTSKDQTRKIVKFMASSGNSIYGTFNNVNVPSAYALIIIKV
nr:MAG TPA: hypothetical protein [Caudoviricetes sp.]